MGNSVHGLLQILSAPRPFLLFLLSSLLFAHDVLADDRKCYSPAGEDMNAGFDDQPIYQPCTNGTVSMCCATANTGNDQCNPDGVVGLCYNYVLNEYWRESCTDPTWESPSCIKLFVNETGFRGQPISYVNGNPLTDVEVTPCPDGSFCSGSGNLACCSAGQGLFIDYATGDTQPNSPNGTTSASAASSPTSSPTSSSSANNSSSSSSSSSSTSSSGLSAGAIAGIVIGVVLGVATLFLAGCFFGRRRKRRTTTRLATAPPGQDAQYLPVSTEKLGLVYEQAYMPAEADSAPHRQPRHELPVVGHASAPHQLGGRPEEM